MLKAARAALAVVLFVTLSMSDSLCAVEIEKFDQMSDKDQDEYVAKLVIAAQKALRDEGKADLAEKVHKLFTKDDPEGDIPAGLGQFEILLARARVADLKRIEKDPNAARLEVEHVMILTLKKNDIALPNSFVNVMKDFKPKHPLKNQ